MVWVKIYKVGSRGFLALCCIWFSGNGKREERKKRLWKNYSNKGKDYYAKVGKAWKRDCLLHSPLGTGKSTMISAMANSLDYNVHDFELTTVKDIKQQRRNHFLNWAWLQAHAWFLVFPTFSIFYIYHY